MTGRQRERDEENIKENEEEVGRDSGRRVGRGGKREIRTVTNIDRE
jgi:hypothetical protein